MSDTSSLMFYILTFLLSIVLVYLGNRDRATRVKLVLGRHHLVINPLLIIGTAIPVLVAGLRQGVGTDFNNYLTEYDAAIQGGSYLEISFKIISIMSDAMFGSPTFMFIMFSALTVIPVMLGINKSTDIPRQYRWLLWMLFLFAVFPQTFNMLRQGVAVAIGFYLLISIIESRKLFKLSHILYLLLAVSFHASAWILVPMGLIAYFLNSTSVKRFLLAIVVITVTFALFFSLLSPLLALLGAGTSYLEEVTISRSVLPRSLLIVVILMICWKFYSVLKISNSYGGLLFTGLLFSVGGLFVSYFERAGYYVTLILPLLLLVLVSQKVPRSQTSLVNLMLCLFALLYFIGIYYLMGSSEIFPYRSVWD